MLLILKPTMLACLVSVRVLKPRGTNINNKGISGSGMGLMISKKIVELHKGQIKLKSKENLGATFSVILQKGSEHYNEKDILIEENDTNESEFFENNLSTNKLILLVEDNEDLNHYTGYEMYGLCISIPTIRSTLFNSSNRNINTLQRNYYPSQGAARSRMVS